MTAHVMIGFKGARDYIHLTDLFPAMVTAVGAEGATNLVFTVHNVITTQAVSIRLLAKSEKPDRDIAARLTFVDAHGQQHIAIATYAETSETVLPRPFDEALITNQMALSGQTAIYTGVEKHTFSEILIATNKALLDGLFPQEKAKWWAVRLQLNAVQKEWSQIALTCLTTEPARLYNTAIYVDSTRVGEISFVSRPS